MNATDRKLALLERLHEVSMHMAEAAHANDWDRLATLEAEQAGVRREAQQSDDNTQPADAATSERMAALIRATLENDAEVRRHVEPWMSSARKLLASGNTGRAMRAAYGALGPK